MNGMESVLDDDDWSLDFGAGLARPVFHQANKKNIDNIDHRHLSWSLIIMMPVTPTIQSNTGKVLFISVRSDKRTGSTIIHIFCSPSKRDIVLPCFEMGKKISEK